MTTLMAILPLMLSATFHAYNFNDIGQEENTETTAQENGKGNERGLLLPRTILKKAIAAHGGNKSILKPRTGHVKGVDKRAGSDVTIESWFDFPNHWKCVLTDHFDSKRHMSFTLATDGKVWEWETGGEVRRAAKPKEVAEPAFGLLIKITALTNGKFKLSSIKEIDVEGRKAVGLRIGLAEDQAECYFDKATGLLIHWEMNYRPRPGVIAHQKTLFDKYKRIDGVVLPHRRRTYLVGDLFKEYTQVAELVLTEVEILKRLPENTFALPEKK